MVADDITKIESIIGSKDGFVGADILLTADWPKGVENHTHPPDELDMSGVGSEAVGRLAVSVKPRYHFAGSRHCFYERTPYRYVCVAHTHTYTHTRTTSYMYLSLSHTHTHITCVSHTCTHLCTHTPLHTLCIIHISNSIPPLTSLW